MNPLLWKILFWTIGILVFLIIISFFIKVIPQNRIGLKRKNIGKPSENGIISKNKSVGYEGKVLTPGIYIFIPLFYSITKVDMVSIPEGEVGYVFARTGETLSPEQKTGKTIENVEEFQDVDMFLEKNGQKGIQRVVLKPGVYPLINTSNFTIITKKKIYGNEFLTISEKNSLNSLVSTLRENEFDPFAPVVIKSDDDFIGIITTNEGNKLDIDKFGTVAPAVDDHKQFQNFDAFINNGGYRGIQKEILQEGTYFINYFAMSFSDANKTIIKEGEVGVQVNLSGTRDGEDLSGNDFRHGNLVSDNERGVSKEILLPGKYPINPFAVDIIKVPTEAILLKWIDDQNGSDLDNNLSSINLTTKDGFQISLPLSVVFNIDYEKAPRVISRFGSVENLVERVLDSFVSSIFKDIGQMKELLEIYQNRKELNEEVSTYIKSQFADYNLEVSRVLVDTPRYEHGNQAEKIIQNLQDRKISKENIVTSKQRQLEQEQVKLENEKKAIAEQQTDLTKKDINKEIIKKEQEAEVIKAQQQKERAIIESEQQVEVQKREKQRNEINLEIQNQNAQTKASVLETEALGAKKAAIYKAEGEAEAIKLVAKANEEAIKLEYGKDPKLKVQKEIALRNAQAIEQAQQSLVPQTNITLGNDENSGNDFVKAMILNNVLDDKKEVKKVTTKAKTKKDSK